ncbi:hypothetical protein [Sphingopyxis sp. 22461]|uniref:hypothetical protein n=1 Tax=Sphingopyxis sp. 22461 TaxID=3453923 RepID=UPI003F87972F
MTDPRYILLGAMQDLMTNYFLDECAANIAWEDFDTEIDALRTTVTDIADDHCRGPRPALPALTTYLVDVDFFSGDDRFATEVYAIDASTPERARTRALAKSLDSSYNDPRIPGLCRAAVARSTDDPATPPPEEMPC